MQSHVPWTLVTTLLVLVVLCPDLRLPLQLLLPLLLLPCCLPCCRPRCQLDASGYKALVKDIQSACEAGSLSPPTLCRLGFHSVHIAASVGKGRGANGGFHAWPVDYSHSSNGGLGDDIKFLLEVGGGG